MVVLSEHFFFLEVWELIQICGFYNRILNCGNSHSFRNFISNLKKGFEIGKRSRPFPQRKGRIAF
ncbi:hypothetical protein DLM76_12305 [Leptospira yasudae]|nr:hypothetical protein DLM76_12305 [Leptospira yasudae]